MVTIQDAQRKLAALNTKAELKAEEARNAAAARVSAQNELWEAKQKILVLEAQSKAQREAHGQESKASYEDRSLETKAFGEQLASVKLCVAKLRADAVTYTNKNGGGRVEPVDRQIRVPPAEEQRP